MTRIATSSASVLGCGLKRGIVRFHVDSPKGFLGYRFAQKNVSFLIATQGFKPRIPELWAAQPRPTSLFSFIMFWPIRIWHGMFLEWWNTTKSLSTCPVYLMRGLHKYARNWNLTVAFWAACKIGQPFQPSGCNFSFSWFTLKKPSWELNFLHIFAVPLSSRHEKCCQIFEILFAVFHHFWNILCFSQDSIPTLKNCENK